MPNKLADLSRVMCLVLGIAALNPLSQGFAAPVITNCPGMIKGYLCNDTRLPLMAVPTPGCEELSWSVTAIGQQPVNGVTIDNNGVLLVTFAGADGGQLFNFRVIVADNCGGADTCQFPAEVLNSSPFLFRIGKLHSTLLGRNVDIPITAEMGSEAVAGFDFLIAYEACVLNFISAAPGGLFGPDLCNWEYFTYNLIDPGVYDGLCRLGLVRLRAVADLNNGDPAPFCYNFFPGDTLASMRFYITHDYWHECEFSPVSFAWQGCGDNSLPAWGQNFYYGACRVFDAENTDPFTDPNYELTGSDCDQPLRYGGECDACDTVPGRPTVNFGYYWNGGVELQCLDPICKRGDLNLNGIAFEVGDVEVFLDYFLFGIPALDPDPVRRAAQICASDINGNGTVFEIADMVMMIRVFMTDTLSIPPQAGPPPVAAVTHSDGVLAIDSPEEIAAIWATFRAPDPPELPVNLTELELRTGVADDGSYRILLSPGLADLSKRIPSGRTVVLEIDDSAELVDIQLVAMSGQPLAASINRHSLPADFALGQNYPNPFNPETKISFELPVFSEWQLEIVNVSGQIIKSYSGRGIGRLGVAWDARDYPSGVYFYRLSASEFTSTRKMVLMK